MASPIRSQKEYENIVKERTSGEIEVIGDYLGAAKKIKVRHVKCGWEWDVVAGRVNKKYGCPKCGRDRGGMKRRLSNGEFIKRVEELVGDDYEFTEPYVTSQVKITVIHRGCGNYYKVQPSDFLNGYRCPHCAKTYQPNTEEFKKKVEELGEGEYSVEGEYVNSKTKILLRHKKCGETFMIRPNDFSSRISCTICRESKGERAISMKLDEMGINYQREKMIGGRLRGDFFLPDIRSFIEFDGIQHYKAIEFWGGEESLKETKRRDRIKDIYFDIMGFSILRIPYWKIDETEEIVEEFVQNEIKYKNKRNEEFIND